MLPAPAYTQNALSSRTLNTRIRQSTATASSVKFPQAHTRSLTAALQGLIGLRWHSHTLLPCKNLFTLPRIGRPFQVMIHTFLSLCGLCALKLPAARRCGVGCAVDQRTRAANRGPRTAVLGFPCFVMPELGIQCSVIAGRTVQCLAGCLS